MRVEVFGLLEHVLGPGALVEAGGGDRADLVEAAGLDRAGEFDRVPRALDVGDLLGLGAGGHVVDRRQVEEVVDVAAQRQQVLLGDAEARLGEIAGDRHDPRPIGSPGRPQLLEPPARARPDQRVDRALALQESVDEVATDEPGRSGDEVVHALFHTLNRRMAQTATVQIQMPEMGESVTEGIVLEWHVAEGDFVNEGDTVVEVSTDKVDAEVPAPADGVITKLIAQVDDEVPVGAPLAEMEPGEGDSGGSGRPRVRTPRPRVLSRQEAHRSVRSQAPRATVPPPRHPRVRRREPPIRDQRAPRSPGDARCTSDRCRSVGVDLGGGQRRAVRGRRSPRTMCWPLPTGGMGRRGAGRRRGEGVAGAGGDAGSGDERESGGAHRHLVPDDRGRHARRQAQGAERAAERAGSEGLLHPPDRLGDRAGGQGVAGDDAQLRGARRQAVRDRERAGQPRHRRRHRAQGRLAQPDGAGDQGRRRPRLRRLPLLLRGPDHEDAREQAHRRRLPGHQHLADQPRRDRHRRLGPPADEGPERDRRRRRDRLPTRVGARVARAAAPARRLEDDDADLDLRPPRDPGCRVGRLPAPDRTATGGRGRLLRVGRRRPRRRRGAARRRPPGLGLGAAARRARRRRPPRRSPTRSCCRRSRPPPRCSRATAPTATSPPASTRSDASRRATRRSSPRTST